MRDSPFFRHYMDMMRFVASEILDFPRSKSLIQEFSETIRKSTKNILNIL